MHAIARCSITILPDVLHHLLRMLSLVLEIVSDCLSWPFRCYCGASKNLLLHETTCSHSSGGTPLCMPP